MGKPNTPDQLASAATNAVAASFSGLMSALGYLSASDVEQVRLAYRFADEAHLGQLRKDGTPYITHPIAVATQCADWNLDAQALMAALLHDAMEDCGVSKSELIERFGSPVAELVDGLTKLDRLQFNSREETQAESFRKMLLAMARDVRVILIKLADRSHNMRTMAEMPRSKWTRIAQETLDIYAPIAHRLGLNKTYRELEELCFRYLLPWRHAVISKAVTRARSRRRDLVQKVQREVEAVFQQAGMKVRIAGREKSLYSIYRKMDHKHLSFAQVTDIYGFRVIVEDTVACYTAMGLLHQLYKPVPGKFKDYIAIPKVNGYQSLHTTLVGPSSLNVEFQLRTDAMHLVAESGVAAHWLYKSSNPQPAANERLGTQWLQSLLDIQDETHDAAEFWDHVKGDLFPDAVYVFTPKGQILALPRGATVVDFAYAIHSRVGERVVSARINNEAKPLRTELKNGDVVEVGTEATAQPDPAWLDFVRTGRARSKIRQHLKTLAQSESQALGEQLLTQALRSEGFEALPSGKESRQLWDKLLRFSGNKSRAELLTDIGIGKRLATMVAKRFVPLLTEAGQRPDAVLLSRERFANGGAAAMGMITLDGSENASVQFATCCRPVPGDAIKGYMGRGEGLIIHTRDCAVSRKLEQKDGERFSDVDWADEPLRAFEIGLGLTVNNVSGVLGKVAAALTAAETDIVHIDMGEKSALDAKELRLVVAVRDLAHWDTLLRSLRRAPWVMHARRLGHADV